MNVGDVIAHPYPGAGVGATVTVEAIRERADGTHVLARDRTRPDPLNPDGEAVLALYIDGRPRGGVVRSPNWYAMWARLEGRDV